MKWQSSEYPPDGTWCWLTDGKNVWIAVRDPHAADGWTNEDTWEDWEGRVKAWKPLETPDPPVVCKEAAGAPIEYDATFVDYDELYNHECPDGVRYAGWEVTLLLHKRPAISRGARYKLTVIPAEPEPAPEPPSWDDAPESAEWLAQAQNGAWVWHESAPYAAEVYWSSRKRAWPALHRTLFPNPNWRDTLQQRPKPEPVCPICGKPASEHRDGLWCCPHCAGEWRRSWSGMFYSAHCRGCGHRTKKYKTVRLLAADVNRRA